MRKYYIEFSGTGNQRGFIDRFPFEARNDRDALRLAAQHLTNGVPGLDLAILFRKTGAVALTSATGRKLFSAPRKHHA